MIIVLGSAAIQPPSMPSTSISTSQPQSQPDVTIFLPSVDTQDNDESNDAASFTIG
jgi:hypothetical protein